MSPTADAHRDQGTLAPATWTVPPLAATALSVGYRRRRRRRDTVVLAEQDLALPRGALTVLLGPNGSGKTTLLRTLVGMQPALAGTVALEGEPLERFSARERARRIAVVLTDPVDAGLLRVVDLVALGRHPRTRWDGRLTAQDHHVVAWALDAVGVGHLAHRPVPELSDGERQRVLIARALAQEPIVLLLDEPVAYVDVARRVDLLGLLRDLAHECGLSVLVTTHDVDLALRATDHVWLLMPDDEDGPARLRAGAPEDLALEGAVGAAFGTQTTTFDLTAGGFRTTSPPLARVRLHGTGAGAAWTERALRREGLDLADPGAPAAATVTVSEQPRRHWRLDAVEWSSDHDSLASLTATLRRLVPHLLTGAASPEDAQHHGLPQR